MQAHPDLEGPWNDLVFELAEATNGRDADCAAIRQATTPPVQAAIDQLMADERPRRDHRPDERPGVADERRPQRGRPQRPLRVLRRLVGGGCGVGLRRHHGARRLRSRDCRSGSPSSAAAGPNRSCSASPTTTSRRRRFVSRRSSSRRSATRCSPASRTRRLSCRRSGSRRRRVSAISSCACGRGMPRRQRSPATRPGFVLLAACSQPLVQPARLELPLLDPQRAHELGIVDAP